MFGQEFYSIRSTSSQLSVSSAATYVTAPGSSIVRALSRSTTSLGGVFRGLNHSQSSIHTAVSPYGALHLSIIELQAMIQGHRSLQSAQIISSEGYVEHSIPHRFLVLELHRDSRKTIWLRLERRAGQSTIRLASGLGSAPAKDSVCVLPGDYRLALADISA